MGDWAEKYSESLKKIYDRDMKSAIIHIITRIIRKCRQRRLQPTLINVTEFVESITGERPYLMRAPSGGYNNTVVKAVEDSGRMYIQWSVDGIDYGDAEVQDIYERSVRRTQNGDIILLHNGTKNTAAILPKILEALECKYEFVTVSELIYKDNYVIDNTGRQFQK